MIVPTSQQIAQGINEALEKDKKEVFHTEPGDNFIIGSRPTPQVPERIYNLGFRAGVEFVKKLQLVEV